MAGGLATQRADVEGLTYAPTGALIAAPTTSLPETPGGERNWDYRYTWVRDSTFALWALYTLGLDREADDFFSFIRDVVAEDDLQIMYGVGGERDLPESMVEGLGGYDGARPVRIGNAAVHQRQLDVWGTCWTPSTSTPSPVTSSPSRYGPSCSARSSRPPRIGVRPDHGIWEVRGEPQHFTSSKLMCWVALDRGARLARLHGQADYARKWDTIAAEIHEDICRNGLDDRGVFVQSYGTTNLDASLLLVPLVRFLPANDPRVCATVLAIADELTWDGLVLRYRPEQTDDGLPGD